MFDVEIKQNWQICQTNKQIPPVHRSNFSFCGLYIYIYKRS